MKGFMIVLAALALTFTAPVAHAAIVKVGTTGTTFLPDSVQIADGDTLRWYWIDGDHSTTSGEPGPNQGDMYDATIDAFNQMFDFQFNTPGTYSNFCIPHEAFGMTGKIVVTPPVQGYNTTFINSFSESDVTINSGETVEFYWGEGSHTLTSGNGSGDPNAGDLINSALDQTVPAIQLTFNTPGDYPFFCIPHEFEGMNTTVHVLAACTCPCAHDPECDGNATVLDVTRVINVAFRGVAATIDPGCPIQREDVDASGVTTVIDVTKVINVAFRGQSEGSNFVDPCL